jgi:hypothetical protein
MELLNLEGRFEISMNSHVRFQIATLGELLVANRAFIWLLVRMGANMNFKAPTPLVRFPTELASMGLLSCMC